MAETKMLTSRKYAALALVAAAVAVLACVSVFDSGESDAEAADDADAYQADSVYASSDCDDDDDNKCIEAVIEIALGIVVLIILVYFAAQVFKH